MINISHLKYVFPDIYKFQAVLTSNKNSGLQNQNLQSFFTVSLTWRLQKKSVRRIYFFQACIITPFLAIFAMKMSQSKLTNGQICDLILFVPSLFLSFLFFIYCFSMRRTSLNVFYIVKLLCRTPSLLLTVRLYLHKCMNLKRFIL